MRWHGLLLAATLLSGTASAEAARAQESGSVLLRYAFLRGTSESPTPSASAGLLAPDELQDQLLEWDLHQDMQELTELLELRTLDQVFRQSVRFDVDNDRTNLVYSWGDEIWELDVRLEPAESSDEVTFFLTAKQDGKTLARPRLTAELGRRVVVSGAADQGYFFFVLEAEREGMSVTSKAADPSETFIVADGERRPPPKLIHKVEAQYTETARRARIQGMVVVVLEIDEQGSVKEANVRKGLPLGLTDQAVAAVKQWRFEPTVVAGVPVKVLYTVIVTFRLDE